MSDFVAGFVSRHAAAPERLREALRLEPGFAAAMPPGRSARFTPRNGRSGPKHFSPADPDGNPTEGWNPLDPVVEGTPEDFDPVVAAHAAGYAAGLQAAADAADEARTRDRALLTGLVEALGQVGRVDRDAMAERLRATVMLLLSRLVGEAGVSAELLAGRVAAATEMLADAGESAMLRVHPDDVPLLDGKLPDTIFPVGDATVARGSFVLEAASTIVEDGPGHWLEQLAQAIDRVAVPC